MHSDTIYALSSAPGKAGVAVIRISGNHAFSALNQLTGHSPPPARLATLRKLLNADGIIIDQALIIAFPAPHSFTGEDVVELHIHGSIAITRLCLQRLSEFSGFRLAEPGEFTRRAFENGKFDLLEVEAVADVIDAETEAQARQALRQLEGHMGSAYQAMRAQILECLALLEAYIDFPEEDIPDSIIQRVRDETQNLIESIQKALQHSHIGERVRSGFLIAIIGAPNAGKSSLLNALAKRDAAIVSPIPGTTRDVIEVRMDIAGYAVIVSDTAGIRTTTDMVEILGIERSKKTLQEADIIIYVLDACAPDFSLFEAVSGEAPLIVLINKADVALAADMEKLRATHPDGLCVSVLMLQGLNELEKLLARLIQDLQPLEIPLITQERHKNLLVKALNALESSLNPLPLEIWCEELRFASQKIGEITGIILPDEILGAIFAKFCIGK